MRSFPRLRLALFIAFALLCVTATYPAAAQQEAPQQQPDQQQEAPPTATIPYVLHVYTNRVQIPALVITRDNQLIPSIQREQFTMRLDSGPPFHPTRIRTQGDDPIILSIVLDASGEEEYLLRNFQTALAALVPVSINPRDRVEIFAADCAVVHVSNLRIEPTALAEGVYRALSSPDLHSRNAQTHRCAFRNHIWDALTLASHSIWSRPGRKVVLAITTGDDRGSSTKWTDLEDYATGYSIAFFAVRAVRLPVFRSPSLLNGTEEPLRMLCNFTGGVVLETYASDLLKTMQQFLVLFRNRYILEFPRAANSTAGRHGIEIHVPIANALIFASGTSVMLPSDAEKTDPNKVPNDETGLPAEGTRRPPKRR